MKGPKMRRPAKVVALIACAAMLVFVGTSLSTSAAKKPGNKPVPTGPTGVKTKKCFHKHQHVHGKGKGQVKHNHKHKCSGKHHKRQPHTS